MSNADSESNAADTAVDAVQAQAQQAVGQLLRQTREKAGLDIAEVARVLRISQRYLTALEDGRNQDLPGTTYAIGFVRSYAEHLRLDGEEIVRRYKAEAQGVGVKNDLIFPKPIPDSGVPGAAVLGLGVIVAVVAYGAWYWSTNADDVSVARVEAVPEHMGAAVDDAAQGAPASAPETEPAAEAAVEAEPAGAEPPTEQAEDQAQDQAAEPATMAQAAPEALATVEAEVPAVDDVQAAAQAPAETPTETPTDTAPDAGQAAAQEDVAPSSAEPSAAAPAAETAPVAAPADVPSPEIVSTPSAPADSVAPAADDGSSRITVRAKSNSWIQIRDEALDRLLFTRLLREGDTYDVPDRAGLSLMTGNAGALELVVDGEVVGAIGQIGEVRRNVELDPDKLKAGTAVTE